MLETVIYDKMGQAYLNSLRRFVKSAVFVPAEELSVIKVPAASASGDGQSVLTPIFGADDARSEIYSLVGVAGARKMGIGTISSAGVTVTGVGTRFISQLQVGDTIYSSGQNQTVATVVSDTVCTTVIAFAPGLAASTFYFLTPINTIVRDSLQVEITDAAWQRRWMNRPVPVTHVFGSPTKPGFLHETSFLEYDQPLQFRLYNVSTLAAASLAVMLEGRKWQTEAFKQKSVNDFLDLMRKRKTLMCPYFFTLDDGYKQLAASTSVNAFLNNNTDQTLIAFTLMSTFVNLDGSTGDLVQGYTAELWDAKNERALQVQPVPSTLLGGTASNPYWLPTPLVIEPHTQIRVRFTNLITDGSIKAMLTFGCVAMYTGVSGHGSAITDMDVMAESRRLYDQMVQVEPAATEG